MICLVDGRPAGEIPCDDRGFLYGETVFETIAFRDRAAPLWPRHMDRLLRGATALGLECLSPDTLLADCLQLLPNSGRFILRVSISGGSGGLGYWPAVPATSRRVVIRRDWPVGIEQQRQMGVRLGLSSVSLSTDHPYQGLKHGNRLLQTAAARECQVMGHEEALLLDRTGQVMEAISSNVLLVRGGVLLCHPEPAVAGVGLDWLKEHADRAVEWHEAPLSYGSLSECGEVLVINSVAGIRPVIEVAGQCFAIGPVCRRLQSLWNSHLI